MNYQFVGTTENYTEFFISDFRTCIPVEPVTPNLDLVEEVLSFIEETRDLFEETPLYTKYEVTAEEYFLRGGCGHFHTILKAQFPQANCYCDSSFNHVVTEIDGVIYDIRGIVQEPQYLENIILMPEIPTKLITNYAFTTNRAIHAWGPLRGPSSVCLFNELDCMTEKEKEECFNFFRDKGETWYEECYQNHLKQKSDENYMSKFSIEAEGIIIPFAS